MTHPATKPTGERGGSGARSGADRTGAGSDPRRRDGTGSHRKDRSGDRRFVPPYDLVTLRAPDGPLQARLDPTAAPAQRRPRPMTFAARSGAGRPPGRWRRLVAAHGWRAYAIPVLVVATFVGTMRVVGGTSGAGPAVATTGPAAAGPVVQAPHPRSTGIYIDAPPGRDLNASLPAAALPPGGPYSTQGGGRFDVVPGSSRVVGSGPLQQYSVEVEAGVAEDGPAFAAAVERILGDPRGWGAGGRMSFQRVDSGAVVFRVSLSSSMTVRALCGFTLPIETSCYNGEVGRALVNDARWVRGAVAYGGNLDAYRAYVISHEVGHALGHLHEPCPGPGAPAPVMMQQTLGLQTSGVGTCRPNPWPYPTGR